MSQNLSSAAVVIGALRVIIGVFFLNFASDQKSNKILKLQTVQEKRLSDNIPSQFEYFLLAENGLSFDFFKILLRVKCPSAN